MVLSEKSDVLSIVFLEVLVKPSQISIWTSKQQEL